MKSYLKGIVNIIDDLFASFDIINRNCHVYCLLISDESIRQSLYSLYFTRFDNILFICSMHLLTALLFFILALSTYSNHQEPFFIIFTNDGSFYKLYSRTKYVEWYSSLKFKLISFDVKSPNLDTTQEQSSYFIPTIDGHFLYIDRNKEILIQRKQVEEILNVCFQFNSKQSNNQSFSNQIKYFVYQRYEYYMLNLISGDIKEIEDFLKHKIHFSPEKFAVLKISKKFLKQLSSADMSIKWSAISSQPDLVGAQHFFKDTKASSMDNQLELNSSKFEFRRISNHQIQFYDVEQKISFEIGGNSPTMAIFQFISHQKGFINHPIQYVQKRKLALEFKPQFSKIKNEIIVTQLMENQGNKKNQINFPHSNQFKNGKAETKREAGKHHQLEFCVNTFRIMKSLTDDSNSRKKPNTAAALFTFPYDRINQSKEELNLQNLPYFIIPEQSPPLYHIQPTPTKEQPYVLIALIISILVGGYFFYKINMNSMLLKMSTITQQNEQKFQQIRKKMGQFEELKRMYEVFWNKMIYSSQSISPKNIPLQGKQQSFEYFLFEGKFLNQDAFVYAVRLQGTDIISIEQKLNCLLNCSHKSLGKLYYYTKNSQFLLIFTQKMMPICFIDRQKFFKTKAINQKQLLAEIIETTKYLSSKLEFYSVPFESVYLNQVIRYEEHQDKQIYLQFKLNAVPCILKRIIIEDSDKEDKSSISSEAIGDLRMNLAALFYLIIAKGKAISQEKIEQELKNQSYDQQPFYDFIDFVLRQAKVSINQNIANHLDQVQLAPENNNREIFFTEILDHPFLWDSKRKMLFLTDFSNYIETYIDDYKVKKLETHAKDYKIIKTPWIKQFHYQFARQVNNYRKYDFESIRDLIRVIRNKVNHFHEIPKDLRMLLGKTPQGFIEYCLTLFPKLLQFTYIYSKKKKWKLHMK